MPDNIIFIVIDSLRYDHVGSSIGSSSLTPHIDRLASESIVFAQAIAQGPSTRVSMCAAMSSTYASMYDGQLKLSERRPVVHSVLRRHGYRTAGVTANLYLSEGFGWSRDFDIFDDCRPETVYARKPWMRAVNQVAKRVGPNLGWPKSMPAEYVFTRSREIIKSESEPTFLWVHLMDTHWPYAIQRFSFKPSWHRKREFDTSLRPRLVSVPPEIDHEEHRELLSEYKASVRYTDEQVGRFLRWLDRRGELARSWVFVTADHGEEFLDHGQYFHHPTLYEELVHVPMIVRPPNASNIRRGRKITDQVQLVDLPPTFLEIAGVPETASSSMIGRSLLPVITETEELEPSYAVIESPGNKVLAVRGDGWKYIWNRDSDKKTLFRLSSDPKEELDISETEPEIAKRMQSMLDLHIERVTNDSTDARLTDEPVQVDEEVTERLRDLGYVD